MARSMVRMLVLFAALLCLMATQPLALAQQDDDTLPLLPDITSLRYDYVLTFNNQPLVTCQAEWESYQRWYERCQDQVTTADGILVAGTVNEYIEYDGVLYSRTQGDTVWTARPIVDEPVGEVTMNQGLFEWVTPGTANEEVEHQFTWIGFAELDGTLATHYQVWVLDEEFNASRGGQVTYDLFLAQNNLPIKDQFNVQGSFEGLGDGILSDIWVYRDINTAITVSPPSPDDVIELDDGSDAP
ncbi:MAG: hypothetical protein HC837_08865 [Chloroflexaceae bacterium]|nr:hypothetical protein [Chloroflexaceae bacterium]